MQGHFAFFTFSLNIDERIWGIGSSFIHPENFNFISLHTQHNFWKKVNNSIFCGRNVLIPSIILANSWPGWKHCKPWLNDPALFHTKCWIAKPGSLRRRPSKSPISSSLSRSRVTSRSACNADKRRVRSRDHVILVCLMLSQISYAPTWFMVSNEAWKVEPLIITIKVITLYWWYPLIFTSASCHRLPWFPLLIHTWAGETPLPSSCW